VGDPDAFDLAGGILQVDLLTGAQSRILWVRPIREPALRRDLPPAPRYSICEYQRADEN